MKMKVSKQVNDSPQPFSVEYRGMDVVFGRGELTRLGSRLETHGCTRAIVVCGSNVGGNDELMEPLRDGLGSMLVDVFDETTAAKRIETAFDGIEAVSAAEADVIVGVGGGSSLNVARQLSVLAADGRPIDEIREAARSGETVELSAATEPTPVAVVPTTFAGADMSPGGSLAVLRAEESPTGQPVVASGSLTPLLVVEDPAAFETTPMGALAGSAMNGFDKAIETLYARDQTPITDALAVRALRYLGPALKTLRTDTEASAIDRAVVGTILSQFENRPSIVHAFGHAFARRYPVQQGVAHAVAVPAVLRYVFDTVEGGRYDMADGLRIDTADLSEDAIAEAIVERVTEIRDALGLPRRFGELSGTTREDIPELAQFVLDDPVLDRAPSGLDPTIEASEAVLRETW